MDIEDHNLTSNLMDVRNLVDPPDVHLFDLKTIYSRCHGLVKSTRSSPQRAQAFANVVTMVQQLADTLDNNDTPRVADPRDLEAVDYMMQDLNHEEHQATPKPRDGAAN